jgi:hypothetical protein
MPLKEDGRLEEIQEIAVCDEFNLRSPVWKLGGTEECDRLVNETIKEIPIPQESWTHSGDILPTMHCPIQESLGR